MICPKCKEELIPHISGMGYECPLHGFYTNEEATGTKDASIWSPNPFAKKIDYNEVPAWDEITVGSAGKRTTIHIPVNAPSIEVKHLIDRKLTELFYADRTAKALGLQGGKKGKEED